MLNLIRNAKYRHLFIVLAGGFAIIGASFLVGCSSSGGISDGWLPATRDYAGQVAVDNAESAKTNPLSAILAALGTAVSSIAGAVILAKKGLATYDAAPYEADDGQRATEDEIVKAAIAARDKPNTPPQA